MDFQGSALDLADLIMDCENADAKHHYKFHRNEEGPFTCIGHILDALKEAHSLGVKQGREEQRKEIIEKYGDYDNGCGCCADKDLKEILSSKGEE